MSNNIKNILEDKLSDYIAEVPEEHVLSFIDNIVVRTLRDTSDSKHSRFNGVIADWISRIYRKPADGNLEAFVNTSGKVDVVSEKGSVDLAKYYNANSIISACFPATKNIHVEDIAAKMSVNQFSLKQYDTNTKTISDDIANELANKMSIFMDKAIPEIELTPNPDEIFLKFAKTNPTRTSAAYISVLDAELSITEETTNKQSFYKYKNWNIKSTKTSETETHIIVKHKFYENITEEKLSHIHIWYAMFKELCLNFHKAIVIQKALQNKAIKEIFSDKTLQKNDSMFAGWGNKVLSNNETFKPLKPARKKIDKDKQIAFQSMNELFKDIEEYTYSYIKQALQEGNISAEKLDTIGKMIWLACTNATDMHEDADIRDCGHGFTKYLALNTNICHTTGLSKKTAKYVCGEYGRFIEHLPERIGLAAKTCIEFESLINGIAPITTEEKIGALPSKNVN